MTAKADASRDPGRQRWAWRWLMGACLLWATAARAQGPIVLRDVTRQTGITFRHTDGSSGSRYIVETVSAGLALFDYDGDGDVDIYFLNGAPLRGARFDVPPINCESADISSRPPTVQLSSMPTRWAPMKAGSS